ncbi:SRPBCC family protein [Nocardioides sp.]|uniref:SRPBCC family protein n=1 Tax=Nocardioides sp. TaxID=35761 RepID=UPI003D10CF1C
MAIVRVSKTTHLPASADEVWAFVSDFAGYASWQPHIESIEMQADGDRKVTFTRGDSILDRITAQDDAAKSLTYGLVPGQPSPMKSLDATFVVTGEGAQSDVEYIIEVDVPDEMQEMARGGIGADIDGALAGLSTKFDG